MTLNWKHKATIRDRERFEINGLNIWDFEWHYTGETIHVNDPLYNQLYSMNVFEINGQGNKVIFSAGEFSNCVWGIYTKE